jgi:N-methylhydantoinase B
MRCDAEGAGEFRGGPGIDYAADVDVAAEYSFRGEGGSGLTAFGINGGLRGQTGSLTLTPADGSCFDVPQYGVRHLPPLRIAIASPGGGGYGDPMRREPGAVLGDVRDGIVSPTKARNVYGVALTSDQRRIDAEATAALRSKRSERASALVNAPSMA